jgi:hypothetical protein
VVPAGVVDGDWRSTKGLASTRGGAAQRPTSNYQPAGNASALAAGRYAVHREGGARFAILRFALTGSGVTETSGTGSFRRAKASRGGLVTGAFAMTGEFCGTMVGAFVSKTIRSGHLRSDFILIIGLSACSLVALRVGSIGSNQFAMNNIAKSRLPTKAM